MQTKLRPAAPALARLPAQPAAEKLAGLEAGRGIAALLVAAVHTWDHCAQAYGRFALGRLFTFGHAGVDFFFVLSGFIILHVHAPDIGRPERLGRYLARRTTRIYPMYWIGLALLLAVTVLARRDLPGPGELLSSALLLPTAGPPVLGVAWTLQQEVLFYAVFALLIWRRLAGQVAFALWLAVLGVAALTPPGAFAAAIPDGPLGGAIGKFGLFFDLEFFFGMAVAWTCRRSGRIPAPRLVLAAGVLAFLAIGLAEDAGLVDGPADATHLGYGLAAAAIVLGLVAAERAGKLPVPRALRVLGGASYSLYLVHLIAVGTLWQALLALGLADKLPPEAAFLLLLAGAVGAGIAVSLLLERPVTHGLRRLTAPPARRAVAP